MAWLNSDDKYHPHALFKVAHIFNKFNAIAWLTGRPSIWDKYGHLESIEPTQPIWARLMYLQLTVRKPIQQESTFWKRSLWEKTGSGLRVEFNFAADLDLWLRFFQYVQHYSVNTLLGGYRMHGNQKAQLFKDKYVHESMKILADAIALYNESEDKSLLPVPPAIEIPREIYNYMSCMDAKTILDKNCWRYYRNDLENLKRIAESQSLHDASRLLKAELSCLKREKEKSDKTNVEHIFNLGYLSQQEGRLNEAITFYKQVIQLNQNITDAYYNLGTIYQDKKQYDEALKYYRETLQRDPGIFSAHFNMGVILAARKNFDQAMMHYQQALKINPRLFDALYNLGTVYEEKKEFQQAAEYYQKALNINPDLAEAYNSLGNISAKLDDLDKAMENYSAALKRNPHYVEALYNLGNLFRDLGKIEEAEKFFRRALEIKPAYLACYSGLLFMMLYNPHYDMQQIFTEHLNFAKHCTTEISLKIGQHTNDKSPSRRLRIGYVSPDFRRHSVSYFIEPILKAHRREQFETYCYSDVSSPDEITGRIQMSADNWRSIVGMTDEEVCESILKDKIDILVDLAGHTENNRLLVFANKPAPVQISWIGYPATTGLSTIDYKLVDSFTDPIGTSEVFYTEKLIRLPDGFLCYLPENESPPIADSPILTTGHITFGSFNNFNKLSTETISLWAKILRAIPNARLIIKSLSLSKKAIRQYAIDKFIQEGFDMDRVELMPWIDSTRMHLDTYNRIDIALDTFPYNGTTTTCEALWMGVPVISLAGNTHVSRVGVSLLSNAGLQDLIAKTEDEYIDIAMTLANDVKGLQSLRKELRDTMAQSPLTDEKRFMGNLEECYRKMWDKWCTLL